MAFPITRLPVKVELQLGGTWTDVTAYTRVDNGIQISRGRRDEAGSFEPGQCSLVLNNQAGRFSPRNPSGPYYGLLTRNTPIRVSAVAGSNPSRLVSPVAFLDVASTPDSVGLSITGDIDLRVDADLRDWTHGGRLVAKYTSAGNQRSYVLDSTTAGKLILYWSTDGGPTGELSATSTVPLPRTTGRQSVRVTMDVDNGAAGRTITFYTGTSVDGPWTVLGAPVVQAGTTSIFNSTAVVTTPTMGDGTQTYALKILQGIGGTERANPDFTVQADGATSFVDAAGNTWTVAGTASITARSYRFYGEVSAWPQAWDISGSDVWVSVQAAGVLRRLGQGAEVLGSALRRGLIREAGMIGYWPMEDGTGSTSAASLVAGVPPLALLGVPTFAADTQFAGSSALPQIGPAIFTAYVPAATAGTVQARCVFLAPAAGTADGSVLMRVYTSGTVSVWDVVYLAASGGTLGIIGYSTGTFGAVVTVPLETTHIGVNGVRFSVDLKLLTSGGNIAWSLTTLNIDTDVAAAAGGLVAGSVGAATAVQVNSTGLDMGESVVGHVHLRSTEAANPYGFEEYVRGWSGEAAGVRVQRLCSEESIPFAASGDLDDSAAMGPQQPNQLLTLLAECEASDLGQLYESRDQLGLVYRTRTSRAVQTALALNYSALSELTPIEDDQNTRNDVTVTRIGGSSARATVDVGPLSTQAPPNGVGRYDEDVQVSLATDAQTPGQANLRVTMGTIDQPRYPVISVQLAGTAFAASPALTTAALDVDHGDLITVTGTPVWLPPGAIRQHTIGVTETLGVRTYQLDFVCMPATPIGSAGLYDEAGSHYDTAGCQTAEALDTTETAIDVTTTTGPVWTQAGADYPFDILIGGEQITVAGCTGTGAAQTFTGCTRSVNGVVKSHAIGAPVELADPDFYI